MEQDFFIGYHNFAGKQRTLSRILERLQGQDLPSIPSFKIYLQALHRRDVSACTIRTVFTGVHGFLVFLQKAIGDILLMKSIPDLQDLSDWHSAIREK